MGLEEEEKEATLNKTQNELLNEDRTLSDIDPMRAVSDMNNEKSLKLTDKIIRDINGKDNNDGLIEENKEENGINPTFDHYQNGADMQPIEEEDDQNQLQDIDGTVGDLDLGDGDLEDEEEPHQNGDHENVEDQNDEKADKTKSNDQE